MVIFSNMITSYEQEFANIFCHIQLLTLKTPTYIWSCILVLPLSQQGACSEDTAFSSNWDFASPADQLPCHKRKSSDISVLEFFN